MDPSFNAAADITEEAQAGRREHPFDLSLIPNHLEVDVPLSQSIALEAALMAQRADSDEDAAFFQKHPLTVSLDVFRQLYERGDSHGARNQLRRRVRIDFDDEEFVSPSDSPNISWMVERHYIDLLVCVGNDMGLGVIIPNQSVNTFYSVNMDFSRSSKQFKAKNVKLGFDPAGSMLWIGRMPSADDIWIAWIPTDEEEEERSGLSSCLSERHYRITVMFFAFAISKSGYRDIVVHENYPDITNPKAIEAASNIL